MKKDLREFENDELYQRVQGEYSLKQIYNTDTSTSRLRKKTEEKFDFSEVQWATLEASFHFDLGERFEDIN